HDAALAVLDEFLKVKGEKLIDDPLKRAVLQRDLWLIFNWLEETRRDFAKPTLDPQAIRTAQEKLRRPLAAVIGRLALSPEEIRKLPATSAAAVGSGRYARQFEPRQPDRPSLPPDLFTADGPWVCVGRTDGVTAPLHLHEAGSNGFNN